MRVFVYEYTSAAPGAVQAPSSLRVEGRAMLTAVVEDFARVPDVEVTALLHEDSGQEPDVARCDWVRARDEERVFRALAGTADSSLIIAPEFDELLATRCRWVLEAGGRLLGPTLAAVTLTADKLALGRHLREHSVRTPSCQLFTRRIAMREIGLPAVLKPRHGAGSQATFLVRDADALAAFEHLFGEEMPGSEAILQSFVPGLAASVAFLMGPGRCVPLLPGVQQLSADGRFRYQGGTMPLSPALAERAIRSARPAVEAVPGLQGYVGVDLVLGPSSDGSGDYVLEINPRLTTSYIGLRALAESNLALAMLRVAEGAELPDLTWRKGPLEFGVNGALVFTP